MVFSPDWTRIATASWDKTVKVWDALTGKELLTLAKHSEHVRRVVFSPDGKRLASASGDKTVKIWDSVSGAELQTLANHAAGVWTVAFSADGKRLASTGVGMKVKEWDSATGQLCRTFPTNSPGNLAYSTDGKRLATFNGFGNVEIIDNPADQPLAPQSGHTGAVTSVAFSPDGQQLASASVDQSVRLWNASTGQIVRTFKGQGSAVSQVAFDSGGTSLTSVAAMQFQPGSAKVWNIASGTESQKLALQPSMMVSISENGSRIASPNISFMMQIPAGQSQSLLAWDARDGRQVLDAKGHSGPISHLALSRDGQWLASAGGTFQKAGEVKVRKTSTGHEQLNVPTPTSGTIRVALSPDGQRLAIAHPDKRVQVWDVMGQRELATFNGHTSQANALAFSPDGVWVASGMGTIAGIKGELKLWNASTGQEKLVLAGHPEGITSLSFSPDGKRLASGSNDETVRVWDLLTGQETLRIGEAFSH